VLPKLSSFSFSFVWFCGSSFTINKSVLHPLSPIALFMSQFRGLRIAPRGLYACLALTYRSVQWRKSMAVSMELISYVTGGEEPEDARGHRWEEQLSFAGSCGLVMLPAGPSVAGAHSKSSRLSWFRLDARFNAWRDFRASFSFRSLLLTGESESLRSLKKTRGEHTESE